uniref:Mobile element protein n=1 Tax=Heterorhabditis bacteriophora TaxID=37862 RepID=A0A1I7WQ06_HETBA
MRQFLAHLLLIEGSISVILRVNEFGLHEAANFTRQWLSMAGPYMRIPELKVS